MPAKKSEPKLNPVESALRDELGPSYTFVVTAQESFSRLISNLRAAGHDLRYDVTPRPLARFARYRNVEILVYDRRTSREVPIIRTGFHPEMSAYADATSEVMALFSERKQKRCDEIRRTMKGSSYAARMQLRLI